MGDTSLVGIVDLMTGEKDPRNLMMVFSIMKVVMIEWDISNHVEVCRNMSPQSWPPPWLTRTAPIATLRFGVQLLPDYLPTPAQ